MVRSPVPAELLEVMMRHGVMAFVMVTLVALAGPMAWAEDAPAEGPVGCVKVIPPRCECVEREIVVPAVTRLECEPVWDEIEDPVYKTVREAIWVDVEVPIWKTRPVPVYTTQRTPIYADVQVPCWKMRRIPIHVTQRTPVFEEIEVPVFTTERVPVMKEVCDPCTGEITSVPCGCEVRVVQCGTRTEVRIKGFEEKQVQCGWRPERFQDGTRTVKKVVDWEEKRVVCAQRYERYQDGTRTERRCSGFDTKQVQVGTRTLKVPAGTRQREVVVCPAKTRVERERITIPCRRVTVVPDGAAKGTPLAGTEEVLTESEYAAAVGR